MSTRLRNGQFSVLHSTTCHVDAEDTAGADLVCWHLRADTDTDTSREHGHRLQEQQTSTQLKESSLSAQARLYPRHTKCILLSLSLRSTSEDSADSSVICELYIPLFLFVAAPQQFSVQNALKRKFMLPLFVPDAGDSQILTYFAVLAGQGLMKETA
ncbi:hypothetical protein MRB53_037315 [Persea americana]|nr:hypothetical protein MRB53_037315 [Persea americana]